MGDMLEKVEWGPSPNYIELSRLIMRNLFLYLDLFCLHQESNGWVRCHFHREDWVQSWPTVSWCCMWRSFSLLGWILNITTLQGWWEGWTWPNDGEENPPLLLEGPATWLWDQVQEIFTPLLWGGAMRGVWGGPLAPPTTTTTTVS